MQIASISQSRHDFRFTLTVFQFSHRKAVLVNQMATFPPKHIFLVSEILREQGKKNYLFLCLMGTFLLKMQRFDKRVTQLCSFCTGIVLFPKLVPHSMQEKVFCLFGHHLQMHKRLYIYLPAGSILKGQTLIQCDKKQSQQKK